MNAIFFVKYYTKYILKRRQCKICLFETSFAYSELVVSTIVLTMHTGLTMDKYCNKKLHVVALITRRLKPMFFEMFSSLPRPCENTSFKIFFRMLNLAFGRIHLPLNKTLMDKTSVKWAMNKTLLFFI